MTKNPVGWFEIYVEDMDRAKQFYESVFELKLEKLNSVEFDMWGFPMVMDGSGASGSLIKIDGCPAGRNSTVIYFSCADCAVQTARVLEFGGKIHRDKFQVGQYGFISLVHDTEGNLFGLHSLV